MSYANLGSLVTTALVSLSPDLSGNFVCDGVADNVTINSALAYINTLGGGEVILLAGTYTLAAPIIVPGNSIAFSGLGVATFIDGDALATNNHAIQISGFTDVVIRNLSIQTNDGGGLTCHCIFIEDGADRFAILNVTILDSDDEGIHIEGTNIVGGLISGCTILDADGSGIEGIADAANTVILVRVEGCYVAGTLRGIYPRVRCNNWTIVGNVVTGCSFGLATEGDYTTFVGNVSLDDVASGINVWGNWATIAGNVINNPNGDGIDTDSADYVSITGNLIFSAGGNGMYLANGPYYTVSGNIVSSSVSHGIHGDNLDNSTISGNVCYNNDSGDTATYDGIYLDADCSDTLVIGNQCVENHRYGIFNDGLRNGVVNNYCASNDRHGILIGHGNSFCNGNYCYINGQDAAGTYHGILLGADADQTMVYENFCIGDGASQEDCIHLADGAVNVQVSGNYCYNGMGSGIALTANNDNCYIHGNYCIINDDYGIEITAATCNDNMVHSNYSVGNVTGARLDAGTLTYAQDNWAGGIVENSLGWSFATIQASVDDLVTGGIGGRVHIPAGIWPEAVTVTDSSIEIFGEGAATLIQPLAAAGHGIWMLGDYDDVHIHDIAVDTKTNGSGGSCIRLEDGADRVFIEGVIIVDSDVHGINVQGTTIRGGRIRNCVILSADDSGILIDMDGGEYTYEFFIVGNLITGCGGSGIATDLSGGNERIIITRNIIYDVTLDGMHCRSHFRGLITDNISYSNGYDGIKIRDASEIILSQNLVYENVRHGLYLHNAENCNVSGNISYLNDTGTSATYDGIFIDGDSHYNLVSGNNCLQNDRDGIRVEGDNNRVTGNICNTNGDYGISTAATASSNFIQDNTLEGNTLGPFNDLGTDTKLATVQMQFVQGTTFISAADNPWGWEIDVDAEWAIALGHLPLEVQQVVRIKIWAVGLVGPGVSPGYMRAQFTGEAAASDEVYTTESIDVVNKNCEEDNFAANDVIHWMLDATDDADIGDIVGGDSIQFKVLHEGGAGDDIETDAIFRCVEFEVV